MLICHECGQENGDQGVFCKRCFIKMKKPAKENGTEKKPENTSIIDKHLKGAEFLDDV